MKKLFILTIGLAFMFQAGYSQAMTKDEKKRLREELKNYLNDLDGYKAKKNDVQTTLDSNDAEIKRLKDEMAYCTIKQTELENKTAAYEKEIARVQAENDQLRNYYNPYKDSTNALYVDPNKPKPAATGGDQSATNTNEAKTTKTTRKGKKAELKEVDNGTTETADNSAAPEAGTVYKVQIGLYKNYNITQYFEQPRNIGYEKVSGMNRYIIGSFDDQKTAQNFVNDVRKMGIKDAFVAKYVDGKRVYEWNGSTHKTSEELKNQLEGGN